MDFLLCDFRTFHSDLKLTEQLIEEAVSFLKEVAPVYLQHGNKINKKALFVCATFIAAQDLYSKGLNSKKDTLPQITVSKLLEKADISIMDFFSVTRFLKTNYNLSEKAKLYFIALERKYLIVIALYDKFESMMGEIFYSSMDVGQTSKSNKDLKVNAVLKNHKVLCWMLFIVAKAKVLWHRQDLLATFHLLLCCIGEIIKITPSFLLLPPFDSIAGRSENPLTILEALSSHFKTDFEEVKAVNNGWLHVAGELMAENSPIEIKNLELIYSDLYAQNGDIDESGFLVKDWHLLPSVSENISSPRKFSSMSVRRTLDTAEALNTILMSADDDITQSLKLCLQKCNFNASSYIKEFLNTSKMLFVHQFVKAHEGSDESLAERRFTLASRFYYIMLDALLKKESERLSPAGFSTFIQQSVFHRSLLACCLEVIIMSCGNIGSVNFTPVPNGSNYQAQGIAFPWILEVYDLEPFVFFKIIESFIRSAPTITLQIINHLKLIEDKILDSLAWKSGSSVFPHISGNGCSPPCRAKLSSPQQSPGFWSPNKDISQQSPSTPHRCHGINLFLTKVCRLGYQRLEKMCNLLDIDRDTLTNIWTCVEHVLYEKTHLLKDRHLDQIIMCCIFGVCKVAERPVLFKTIIACYGQLSNFSSTVYKQVLSNGKKEFIVHFLNREFSQEMQTYINSLCGNKKEVLSSTTSSPVVLSPLYSLPEKRNLFVTTLTPSPFKNPNEIIFRKQSFKVGSLTQSTKMLQDINISLNSSPSPVSSSTKGKKRIQFDSEENYSERKSPTISSAKKFLKFD
ncbi:retinoblastoma-associated protein isoform X1 [Parasteatoda tepidariorum]|nr:retinoblastoma-associated protein isoform X2 [Parasteatoda tepidariorum]XP_042898670.1 retinoblastoma-associated protein isoform X1 [Parasteatoda tepidariorum]